MIDIQTETIVSLTEAAQRLPSRRAGKRVNVSTLWRWATSGSKGIRLETVRIGASRYTSMEAIQRFSDALSRRAETQTDSPSFFDSSPLGRARSAPQRQRASENADRILESRGG